VDRPHISLILALLFSGGAFAADTWEPSRVYPDCRLTVLWPNVKAGLKKSGETIRETYVDEDGNNWMLFSNDDTGSWTVFVVPEHMMSFKGTCLHGHGDGLVPSPVT